MAVKFLYFPLEVRDIPELANALHSELVYQYIGGMPSRADFDLWLRRSIAGPPSEATGERWLNFTVRLAESKEVIGRLEANIHDHLAELAFLHTPRLWRCGYASQGLLWLQSQLRENTNVQSFWATTHPENQRSAGLLQRQGYVRVPTRGLPTLYSYDSGDHVYKRSL
jgi:RimJ/RimL family protein N-acetyltransferase